MVIPEAVERRARWVLDTIGAHEHGFGDELPFRPEAWEAVERGERPVGCELAECFFHLARLEERGGARDRHGRFPASASCLDPTDPPLDRLRARLRVEPPRWGGGRFAVVLTHGVNVPWRWTRVGVRGAAGRLKGHVRAGRRGAAIREARALGAVPFHKIRGTDPNWSFARITRIESARGVRSTFFVMTSHRHRADGPAPEEYERLRPKVVETLLAGGADIGLLGSYTAAADVSALGEERAALERLGADVAGQRFHYLRVDPHDNLRALPGLGFDWDSSLGFADAPGFRAGLAHPYRPWDVEADRPLDLVEIPLAAMDVTFSEPRYLGLSVRAAEQRLIQLLDLAAERGGGFAVLWRTGCFDPGTSGGWDRLYFRLIDAVRARGGVCLTAGDLAEEAGAWLR